MFFFNHCCCGHETVNCRPAKPEGCDRPHCDLADRECCCLRCRQESQNCRCRENKCDKCENNCRCRCCERKCNCGCRCCEKRHECPCSHGGMIGDYDN